MTDRARALAREASASGWAHAWTEGGASARAKLRARWEAWAAQAAGPALEWALEHPASDEHGGSAAHMMAAGWVECMGWAFDAHAAQDIPGWKAHAGAMDPLWAHLETVVERCSGAIGDALERLAPLKEIERAWTELQMMGRWERQGRPESVPAPGTKLAKLAQLNTREWDRLHTQWGWLRKRVVFAGTGELPDAALDGCPLEHWVAALAREEARKIGIGCARTGTEEIAHIAAQWPFGQCQPALATCWALATAGEGTLSEREWAAALRVEHRPRGARNAREHLGEVRARAREIEAEIEAVLATKAQALAERWAPKQAPARTLARVDAAVRAGWGLARGAAYGSKTEIKDARRSDGARAQVALHAGRAPEVRVHEGTVFVEHKGFEDVGSTPVRLGEAPRQLASACALVQIERREDGTQHVRVRQGTPQIEVIDAR